MKPIDLTGLLLGRPLTRTLPQRLPRFRPSNPLPSIDAAHGTQQPTFERGD